MSKNYDNWEKLVGGVLKREKLKQLALSHSMSCSTISDDDVSSLDEAHKIQTVSLHYDATDDASIWEMFLLPQEYQPEIVSRSVNGVVFLPVEAQELVIQTANSPAEYLHYSSNYPGRFETVEVNSVLPVDIVGKIRTRLLTSKTIYGVYLVFLLGYNLKWMGLETSTTKAVNRFVDERESRREKAVRREDGWMEVQIGSVYVGDEEQEVEARARLQGAALDIDGMEFRPLVVVKQL